MMTIVITMIASYTNDDDRHRYDYRIVHIVYALAMYDAILFGDGRTEGRTNKAILGVGWIGWIDFTDPTQKGNPSGGPCGANNKCQKNIYQTDLLRT